jgi:hypothetical protein
MRLKIETREFTPDLSKTLPREINLRLEGP